MYCGRLFTTGSNKRYNFILMLAIAFVQNLCLACEPPMIIFPAQHAEVFVARPVMSWLPVPGAVRYDISVQNRIPEGEVSGQFSSTTTATQFISPRPLTRARAVVAVKVKAHCDSETSAESTRIFFTDVRALCPLPRELLRVPMGQFVRVSWVADERFKTVEVRRFGAESVGELARVPQGQSFAILPADDGRESVVGVRGNCDEADGEWGFVGR